MGKRSCPGCRELRRRVAELEAQVRELLQRLGQNASNSSLPPSSNPPGAPKPVVKESTGRKPGGQPGHVSASCVRLPPERVRRVIHHVPKRCVRCQQSLPAEPGPRDPEPSWHQMVEIPEVTAFAIEHQGHARTCSACGALTRTAIPADVRRHRIGPRLAAVMAYLSGARHESKRGVEEIVETVFGVPVGLGTVVNVEQEMSQALRPAHAQALAAVRQASVKHADETGWKLAGRLRWLWTAATARVAAFRIHARRGRQGLSALLGKPRGWLCSDRWSAYGGWPLYRRQVCWAHLKRDFQKLAERGGAAAEIGEAGLDVVSLLFDAWHLFRGGTLGRRWLQRAVARLRRDLRTRLQRGCACTDAKAARFCRNLLALEPALWTFARVEGVEPTNNHAERMLRSAVLWRKRSFGCHSTTGCRFVERILTVVQTLRLRGDNVLAYLYKALLAHRQGLETSKLLLGV